MKVDTNRIDKARKYPLGTRYTDEYGMPWMYIKKARPGPLKGASPPEGVGLRK